MKIGLVSAGDEFTTQLRNKLEQGLGEPVAAWKSGSPAPEEDFEALVVMGKLSEEEMRAQPKLKLIQTASAGYDGIAVEAATKLGIRVAFAPSGETGNAVAVAEFAVLLLLGASRRLKPALDFVRDRSAKRPELNKGLKGKTVCIVGLGGIGEEVADRLRGFGVVLTAVNRHPAEVKDIKVYAMEEIKTALAEADYVVLCLRGTEENENLFNAELFAAMKPGSVLVNIARGSLIDEPALIEAVKSRQLFAAGLDVEKHEPVESTDPLVKVPEILVTPHLAWSTEAMLDGTAEFLLKTLQQYAKGTVPESLANEVQTPRDGLAAPKQ